MSDRSNTATDNDNPPSLVGGDMLSLITSGMYSNPLTIYREYLQNAADSIAASGQPGGGEVDIKIDVSARRVTIRDYGPGLSYMQAKKCLIPVSQSGKSRQHDRGFRGIGRLSGLAFGSSVEFLTRQNKKSPVTQIIWHGEKLRHGIENQLSVAEIISQCVTVDKINEGEYPASFFEVQVHEISRFAASSILNRDVVRQYIGEICPVPFEENFPFANQVFDLFLADCPLSMINVRLNEDISPVTRLHTNGIYGTEDHSDKFIEFETIRVPTPDSEEYAATGWIAHSSYLGALRKSLGIRGLRARVGNIQIGDDQVFDHLFTEDRFNRWCVGEVHILDPRIVPNGRRDYFEPNAYLRNLENHLGAVCRKLEQRCRMASKQRARRKRLSDFLDTLGSTYELVTSGYLSADTARQFSARKLSEIPNFRNDYADRSFSAEIKKLDDLEKSLKDFRFARYNRPLSGVASRDVRVYRKIFAILAETSSSPQRAKQMIEAILDYETT